MSFLSYFSKEKKESLNKGLFVTKQSFFKKLGNAITGKATIDDEVLENLEEILLTSDVGVDTSLRIIGRIKKRVAQQRKIETSKLNEILREEIALLLVSNGMEAKADFELPTGKKPYVIMVVGVNGVGKTTTIGKLAHQYIKSGRSVMIGAADTFRAAAVDQIKIWSERTGAMLVSQGTPARPGHSGGNADPASVAFDTITSATAKGVDIAIIDTAGRLHNKVNLMNELTKIKNVMRKIIPDAPHEILLVLDASTGQNAIEQCKQFTAATDVNALALTKLDGTAKGGVVIGISDTFKIPVKYIGVGEKMEDLQVFNKHEFVDSLFKK